ncbi:Phospholipid scramblase 3 [Trichoplax sp. H2]|nr:Phospholipid scramblase 3 [Trichoplax sp. H2]|eukprot:RDD35831.1 Phospholipid scramblase 3 [Trichoplax sp. H2]
MHYNDYLLIIVPTPFSCNCCSRLFHMKILDANDKEVMHYSRPYRCGLCCCCCCFTDCMEDMTIESPTGNAIGSIRQTARIGPNFQVLDTEKNKIFNVNGPFGVCACMQRTSYTFDVVDTNGQNVGSIVKGWSGMRSVVSQDRLDINFPMDLDVKNKALMMGAGILIDYMLFQRVMANNNRR